MRGIIEAKVWGEEGSYFTCAIVHDALCDWLKGDGSHFARSTPVQIGTVKIQSCLKSNVPVEGYRCLWSFDCSKFHYALSTAPETLSLRLAMVCENRRDLCSRQATL